MPSARKIHGRPTPLFGGIGVLLAFTLSATLFLRPMRVDQMVLLLAGAAAFSLIGLLDDLYDVGAPKLAAEAIVVVAIVWAGGIDVKLPWPYAGEVLAVLWILGVANAFNCLDCVDGVATGTAAVIALLLIPLALFWDHLGVAIAGAALAGSALGFLRFNFSPARIFLGDAGSLMLGFLAAALPAALVPSREHHAALVTWIAPVLLLGIPVGDFLLVHVRRYLRGVTDLRCLLTSTGRDHLPHRLLDAGLTSRRAAVWLYGSTALTGGSGVALVVFGPAAAALPVAVLAVVLLTSGIARQIMGASVGPARGARRLPPAELAHAQGDGG